MLIALVVSAAHAVLGLVAGVNTRAGGAALPEDIAACCGGSYRPLLALLAFLAFLALLALRGGDGDWDWRGLGNWDWDWGRGVVNCAPTILVYNESFVTLGALCTLTHA